jgi:SAM-dependent methyltransferase
LRDPEVPENGPLEVMAFPSVADFEPFAGKPWGVLRSAPRGILFPYCGSVVFFVRTPEADSIFHRVRMETDKSPALSSAGVLVGDQTVADHRNGLFSADQISRYDECLVDTVFWTALQKLTFRDWARHLPPPDKGVILDLGCGTGRCIRGLGPDGYRFIGVDLSCPMLARIAGSTEHPFSKSIFLLASAVQLPLATGSLSGAVCFGSLHHVSSPREAILETTRVMAPGAVFQALEPNDSPVRPLFDMIMKCLPLWEEEAGDENLFTSERVRQWARGLPLRWHFRHSIFVLPHLLSMTKSVRVAADIIRLTDQLQHLPMIRRFGGLLLFRAEKAQ